MLENDNFEEFIKNIDYLKETKKIAKLNFNQAIQCGVEIFYLSEYIFMKGNDNCLRQTIDFIDFSSDAIDEIFGPIARAVANCDRVKFEIIIEHFKSKNLQYKEFIALTAVKDTYLVDINDQQYINKHGAVHEFQSTHNIDGELYNLSSYYADGCEINGAINNATNLDEIYALLPKLGNLLLLIQYIANLDATVDDIAIFRAMLSHDKEMLLELFGSAKMAQQLINVIESAIEATSTNNEAQDDELLSTKGEVIEDENDTSNDEILNDEFQDFAKTIVKQCYKKIKKDHSKVIQKYKEDVKAIFTNVVKQEEGVYKFKLPEEKYIEAHYVKSNLLKNLYVAIDSGLDEYGDYMKKIEAGIKVLPKKGNEGKVGIVMQGGVIKFKNDSDTRLNTSVLYENEDSFLIFLSEASNHQIIQKKMHKNKNINIVKVDGTENTHLKTLLTSDNIKSYDKHSATVMFFTCTYDLYPTDLSEILDCYNEKKIAQNEFKTSIDVATLLLGLADAFKAVELGVSLSKLVAEYLLTIGKQPYIAKHIEGPICLIIENDAAYSLNEKLQNQTEYFVNHGIEFESLSSAINHGQISIIEADESTLYFDSVSFL